MGDGKDARVLLGALDCLRTAITLFDQHGRLVYANAHINYIFKSFPSRQSLIGKSYTEWIQMEIAGQEIAPQTIGDDVETFIAQRLSQLQPHQFEPRDLVLADRRILEIKARHTEDGHTLLMWSDVTSARAQLARLQEAVALSAEAFAFFDSDDRLILANDIYAHLCGVKNHTVLIGKTFSEIAAAVAYSGRIVLAETPEHWLERRLQGHCQPMGAVTLQTNTGEAYLVRDRATPDGGRVVVFTDTTDRLRAETALAEQKHALADAHARAEQQKSYLADLASRLDAASAGVASAKTTLLRTMSHELKTPLNTILGFSELMVNLAAAMPATQIREYAGLIHQGGSNLLKIINNIMDLTKISAGRFDLQRRAVDAGGMMWLARDGFGPRAAARGLSIDADQCPVGLMVQADENALTSMVHNLIDNAVTFTTGSRITLSVTTNASAIAISVADDGQGVAPEDLARIQEPFEHAGKNEAAHHSMGAGLGLTVVKALAELHGGRLELQSAPGQGFAARIILPHKQWALAS